MGFFFRKSLNFGPIRLNFSKSGIGVSAGVKGARISTGPRGTYVHAGRHGFYYSQKIGSSSQPLHERQPQTPPRVSSGPNEIPSADVSSFKDTNSAEVLDRINANSNQFPFAPIIGVAAVVISAVFAAAFFSLLEFAGIARQSSAAAAFGLGVISIWSGCLLTWKVHKGDEMKRTTPMFYELDAETWTRFGQVGHALSLLSRSKRIWRVRTQQATWDWKRNAGASSLLTRSPASILLEQPKYVATNLSIWCIRLNDQSLYFMPDYILIKQGSKYGAVSYDNFQTDFAPTRFIEDQGVPSDARVVDYTWRFVNKKGGPDRRFSNNTQIPICEYGFVHLSTRSGLNIHLHVSSSPAASAFNSKLEQAFHRTRPQTAPDYRDPNSSERRPNPKVNNYNDWAFVILEVSTTATRDEIVAAYRQKAMMYHPDRLTHLAPEFVQLAEERMKDINRAYDFLVKNR